MRLNRKSGIAILIMGLGILILSSKLGFHMGHLMGFLVPLAMVGLGYLGIKNGRKFGWLVAALGLIILLGKLSGLFVILIAIGLIGYGVSMLKRSPNA